MASDQRQELGRAGEEHAARHYTRLGYTVLARRHRTRFGELDLVVRCDDTIAFCEVKARRAGSGSPWESLHDAKRLQVRRMAAAWLAEPDHPYAEHLRFDAVGVVVDAAGALVALEHIEAAF